ncbi:MAG TPA: hypothetical protein VHC69_25265 [Polyangiaceae bacterium]|nr:hypothetical protein [Polyangiaceae bacterium]
MAQSRAHVVHERAVRLAQNESTAVDLCSCGMLQLHLGALTLRFDAPGFTQFVRTLGVALVRAREAGLDDREDPIDETPWRRAHGDA